MCCVRGDQTVRRMAQNIVIIIVVVVGRQLLCNTVCHACRWGDPYAADGDRAGEGLRGSGDGGDGGGERGLEKINTPRVRKWRANAHARVVHILNIEKIKHHVHYTIIAIAGLQFFFLCFSFPMSVSASVHH